MKKVILLLVTHVLVGVAGFAAGIYALPILIAPPAPSDEQVAGMEAQALYTGVFRRDLQDSDALHWGEGTVSVGEGFVSLRGRLAPGPDYRLYLSPAFLETEADFLQLKQQMLQVGNVRTFENFRVELPFSVDPAAYNTVIVWCESFGQFITAARYQ